MLLPAEIAEVLTPLEYVRLCGKVEDRYKKDFGVVSVTRKDASHTKVEVEFGDNTRETVIV